MDAFYASIEQRDNPKLKGKPIAVGGYSQRGVLATASYEAREFGIHSAMPTRQALKICPHLILVKPRFEAYKEVSRTIQAIFHEYTDLVEPLALDEAFLDVTHPQQGPPSAFLIAQEIRKRIFETTQLTCSAGVSSNKFVAKVASDLNKPNGITLIKPEEIVKFMEELKIEKFFGIGKVTARRMHALGIYKGIDLKNTPLEQLLINFGKAGQFYHQLVRGIDDRPVRPNRTRKSIGAERTFEQNYTEIDFLKLKLDDIASEVFRRMSKAQFIAKTITLKIKYGDFSQHTRSRTTLNPITTQEEINRIAHELLEQSSLEQEVRLLGISLSNLISLNHSEGIQLSLNF